MSDFIFGQLGVDIIHFVQSFSSPIPNLFFIIITNFGDVPFYLVALALIYWLVSKKTGAHLAAALIIFGYVTELIKGFVGWTRPFLADPSKVKLIGPTPKGYSFPSGHSQSTGTFWPVLVSRCTDPARKKILVPVAIFFIIVIPFSRVYLGVHYPGDVTFGVVMGLIGAFLYIKYNQTVIDVFKDYSEATLIGIIFVLSILMTLLEIAGVLAGGNSLKIAEPGILPGMMLGAFTGFLLENKYVKFVQTPTQTLFYVTRIVIGGVVVGISYVIPHFVLGIFTGDYFDILRHFVEFTLIGFGIAVVTPYIFTKFEEYWTRRSKA